jgi:UDP-N-acetyl-D-mannosaminuronic acid dehydrogenase
MQTICVLGLGYIGLPTASVLATKGHRVIGVDVNERAVDTINRGEIHIHEPDLDVLVKSAVLSGNLTASLTPQKADTFIIAVPTPFSDGHVPDLSYIESAVRSMAPVIEPGNLIILESTSPIGATEKIAAWLRELRPDLRIPSRRTTPLVKDDRRDSRIYLAHCPERVLPGQILRELVDNDRIIGGIDPQSADRAADLYRTFVGGEIVCTDSRTAELAKLTENAFRDVNIAFANELSVICDDLSIDVWELIRLANRHPRVNILQPGPGVGGHCIAVDPWFIVHSAPERAKLIATARRVNDAKPGIVLQKVVNRATRIKDPVIACLGLSFKADVDDVRESPALHIVEELAAKRIGKLLVVEPHLSKLPQSLESTAVDLVELEEALAAADIVVGLVNHKQFLKVDRQLLNEKIVIDTRGMWR